ncbi:DNA polymerase III subunit gamma/tau [Acidobacteria bacterium AB60]|nr:DNA polymerase III subunit gamma/tau [Acidobacteria bacterium AB60]
MGYQVLARKYRPQRFADVAGQDHVTRTLLNALNQNRIAHGYIFSGHRGIGKTTIARILAQALNCRTEIGSAQRPTPEPCGVCDSCIEIRQGNAVDVIEIDAATNRGIDEIRELRDAARYAPARDRFKIYILDEAHQITEAAFNALLKTLEEPPAHVVFMMATTEPENIPQTIRSRCQHFSFHAVKFEDILGQLNLIAAQEQVEAEEAALALLAEAGDGSMRDALSIMDQAIASAPCNEAGKPVLAALQIRDLMGSVPNTVFERLLEAVAAGQSAELMEQLNVLLNAGHSPSTLARQMVRYLRNALMAKLGGEQTELLQISADERARAARSALLFSEEDLTRNLQIMLRTFDDLNYRQEQRFHLELGMLKLVHAQRLLPLEELLSGVAGGAPAKSPGAASRGPVPRSSVSAAAPPPPRPAEPARTAPAAPPAAPSISPFGSSGGGWGTGPSIKQSVVPERVTEAPPTEEREERAIAAPSLPEEPAIAAPGPVAVDPPAPRVMAEAIAEPAAAPITPAPFPAASAPPIGYVETATEGALAKAPEPAHAEGGPTVEALRAGVIAALAQGGHASASTLLASGNWILDVASLRIEVAGLGKKMLSLTVNPAAEKIIRQELARLGGPARFMVVPGEGAPGGAPQMAAAPLAGSIQEEAMKNPLVQRAKEIFNAEVRSVVDLRTK